MRGSCPVSPVRFSSGSMHGSSHHPMGSSWLPTVPNRWRDTSPVWPDSLLARTRSATSTANFYCGTGSRWSDRRLLSSCGRFLGCSRPCVTGRRVRPDRGPRGSETELLALAVDDAERRRGVGAALVEAFIRTSRGAGSSTARVVVGTTNHRAIALYGRAGFRESTRLQLHSGADSLVMRVGLQATSL